jgi:hypothetical protein
MEKFENYNLFEEVENYIKFKFNEVFKFTNTIVDHKCLKSIHSTDLIEIYNHSHEITFLNDKTKRNLYIDFYHGFNGEVKIINSINIQIENTIKNEQISRSKFSIEEFLKFKEIELNQKLEFYHNKNSLIEIKIIIDNLITIIISSSLIEIINGKSWENIPIDMSPYK